jgi:hypothetical protein
MSKQFTAYAPPMAWGVWHTIESHGGSIARTITYEPIGDTVVKGKVKYFKFEGEVVEEEFKDKVSIKTGQILKCPSKQW